MAKNIKKQTRKTSKTVPLTTASATASSPMVSGIIIVVLAILLGGILYVWQESAYDIGKSEAIESRNIINADYAVNNKQLPEETVAELFEKALNDKNYAKMKEFVTPNVNYIVEATECCGIVKGSDAIENLKNYTSDTKYFNFSENQQLVKQFKVNLAKQFGDKRIGIGNDEKVLAYHINSQGKVDDIYLAITHKLFDLE